MKKLGNTAEKTQDADDKTISNWSEHSSFLENSRIIQLAPPPRMDHRLVPPPPKPGADFGPILRKIAVFIALALGAGFGLYSNGMLDPLLKSLSKLYAP